MLFTPLVVIPFFSVPQTAEMPGFYDPGEYDLAGFAVGAVKKDAVIDGSRIAAGDVVLGFPSSGVHSNGFSLVRKVLEVSDTSLHDIAPWSGESFGLSLLTPTVIYVRDALKLIESVDVKVSGVKERKKFSFFELIHP